MYQNLKFANGKFNFIAFDLKFWSRAGGGGGGKIGFKKPTKTNKNKQALCKKLSFNQN